jgi:hypothetical protein
MFKSIKAFFGDRAELNRFKASPESERQLVFYAEGAQDWPHFEAAIHHLTCKLELVVSYVTSQPDDPALASDSPNSNPNSNPNPNLRGFCVGSGTVRTLFFQSLEAQVLVMTMPEIETSFLKRSQVAPVHYVYLFHAISSSHMVYQKGAFDGYDSVLCVGPHHVAEIRETERVYELPEKILVEHGYGRLDALIEKNRALPPFEPSAGDAKKVLVASSWGVGSFIEMPVGRDLIRVLLADGHEVTARLHPMTVRRLPELASELEGEFAGQGRFRVETDMSEQTSLHESDIMICDWSGAGSEYAFALGRPVLYIDTPRKINNPEYQKIGLVPLEESIRTEIGDLLDPGEIERASQCVRELTRDPRAVREKIDAARERLIFNNGRSGEVAGNYIHGLLEARSRAGDASADVAVSQGGSS